MKILKSLLQFTTILPLGKPQDLEPFARHSYLYPVAGYVIGALVALPVFFIADKTIAAAVAVALIMLISGAHHFDGLLDFGDGLMAHGDREKRIRALTDRYIGAGGVAAGIVITLLLFAGLQASTSLVFAIIIGEVCAKFS
ncbi:MAG: adenosylcobinamide-GDP ribazoletransferase, partial [Methanomicrobiales archaeon]